MQHFLLPSDLGQAILDYLAKRPYAEVYAMVQGLQQMQPAPETIEPEATAED